MAVGAEAATSLLVALVLRIVAVLVLVIVGA
jgi:hypothetical protein